MKHLIAGATGYLVGYLVEVMRRRGLDFRAIARNPDKLEAAGLDASQILVAQVTKPESIKRCCEGVDSVLSSVGITRQKGGLTYMDVDYQANGNLLDEALRAGFRKFVYVSVLNGARLRKLTLWTMRAFTSVKAYEPLEFLHSAMASDNVAPFIA